MEQSPSISTPSPSRISAASLTSQEPSGSVHPWLAASESQCGNASREYPAMLPEGATVSPSSIETASSTDGDGGAPAAVEGAVTGTAAASEGEPVSAEEPSPAGSSSQGTPS